LNRRELLAMLGGSVLIVPALILPRRKFFLPPKGGWFAVADMAAVDYVSVSLGYAVTYEDIADNLYSFRPDEYRQMAIPPSREAMMLYGNVT
jgi:hypothetical protein